MRRTRRIILDIATMTAMMMRWSISPLGLQLRYHPIRESVKDRIATKKQGDLLLLGTL
jgi:hypothetical protein